MQPGGFQYVLRYSCHPADVSALALATKLKLVAVADDSGTVSLLDLLQVGVLRVWLGCWLGGAAMHRLRVLGPPLWSAAVQGWC